MKKLTLPIFLLVALFLSSCSSLLDKAAGLDLSTSKVIKIVEIVRMTLLEADLDKDGHIKGLDEWSAFVIALFGNIKKAVKA